MPRKFIPSRLISFLGLLALGFVSACGTTHKALIVPPDPKLQSVSCIAILPFENLSGRPQAGKIVSDILATELYSTKRFNLLEWEEALNTLNSSGVSVPDSLDAETAQELARQLGVEAVLIGTVSDFSYGSTLQEIRPGLPSVAFTARLIEAQSGNPLWASALSMSSGEVMEPRRESINHLAQVAAVDMVNSLVRGKKYQPVDAKNICWQKRAPAPRAVPAPAAPAPPPRQVPAKPKVKPKIAVLNASGVDGLEENIGLILLMKNWDVTTLAKYPYKKTFSSTTIYYRSGYDPEAKAIEAEIPGSQKLIQTEKMAEEAHITILVGKDQIGQ